MVSLFISLDADERLPKVILMEAREILHPEFILDRDIQLSARLQALSDLSEKSLIGVLPADVIDRVLENADEDHCVILPADPDIPEIADKNLYIIEILMPLGIDKRPPS